MKNLRNFLFKELPANRIVDAIMIVVTINLGWSIFLLIAWPPPLEPPSSVKDSGLLLEILRGVIIAPIKEEVIFRLPLFLFYFAFRSFWLTLIVALASSIIFGWLHGGTWHIFCQGVAGMLLALLFLKAGGLHGRPFKALGCSILAHGSFNAVIALITALP